MPEQDPGEAVTVETPAYEVDDGQVVQTNGDVSHETVEEHEVIEEPESVLGFLKDAYQEALGDRRKVLAIVPGRFRNRLAARYRPVEWEEQRKQLKRAQRSGADEEAELNYAAAMIADSCETILVRSAPGTEWRPMNEEVRQFVGGEPVRYDGRLAAALGIDDVEGMDSKAICRLVFHNRAALLQHHGELDQWQREAVSDDDEDMEDDESRPT